MKKISIAQLFYLFFVLLFVSCSQESGREETAANSKSAIKIQQVLDENDLDTQKIKYNLLSGEEKYSLWNNKYESLINGTYKAQATGFFLNEEQKELIQELKNKITVNVYNTEDSDEKAYFKNIYTPSFLKKAEKIFTYEQIGNIFYKVSETASISAAQHSSAKTASVADAEKPCVCNVGAIFTCQWGGERCEAQKCVGNGRPDGCGFNWDYPCDGLCNLI